MKKLKKIYKYFDVDDKTSSFMKFIAAMVFSILFSIGLYYWLYSFIEMILYISTLSPKSFIANSINILIIALMIFCCIIIGIALTHNLWVMYKNIQKNKYFAQMIKKYPILIDFLYYYAEFLPNKLDLNHQYQLTNLQLSTINRLVKLAQLADGKGINLSHLKNQWFVDLQDIIDKIKFINPNLIIGEKSYYIDPILYNSIKSDVDEINDLIRKNPDMKSLAINDISVESIKLHKNLLLNMAKKEILI